jgi:tetratricopeptide (TPR) repeat protein
MNPIETQMKEALHYHRAGELARADEIYSAILSKEPNHPDALHLSGLIAHQSGRQDRAIELIQKAVFIAPRESVFFLNLGNALAAQSRLEEAIECYYHALHLSPTSAKVYYNLGNALREQRKLGNAIFCYEKSLRLSPDFYEAYANLIAVWLAKCEFEKAIKLCRKALEVKPDDPDILNQMGIACKGAGKSNEAASYYEKAIRLNRDAPAYYFNLGNVLHEQGRLEKAAENYRKALELAPHYASAHDNLGKTYRDMGMLEKAASCYERSLHINPDNAETQFDMATLHLLRGDFARGWSGYEWRFKRKNWKSVYPIRLGIKRWNGAPFSGKRLLVHSEQGFGDSLQFARYLPMVKALGGEVVFETVSPLMRLFQTLEGVDSLIEGPAVETPTACDLYVPLLSLPGVFKTRMDTIPSQVPYLFADPEKTRSWRERLLEKKMPRIGLVWAGKTTDRRRSCPLGALVPLLDIPGVEFIGLQKGEAIKEMGSLPSQSAFLNIGDAFNDFSDTAAAIENLDLVISIDTAVAHLAGAMGKPVRVLLLMSPDWRWLMDRIDSPWYPTMRLFRQLKPGDWDEPVNQLAHALRTWRRDWKRQGGKG